MIIAIVPTDENLLSVSAYKKWKLYSVLTDMYNSQGIYFKMISEIDDYNIPDWFIFFNCSALSMKFHQNIVEVHRENRTIYWMGEPESVMFWHSKKHLSQVLKYFNYIVTWNEGLADNKRVFFLHNYYFSNEEADGLLKAKPFVEKKLFVNITSNKQSKSSKELYSERQKVIEFFEKYGEDFDLYGTGWEQSNYKNYKGTCASKLSVYNNYKFALALENTYGIKGYVTEKMLDCIRGRVVPIYKGACDVEKYVPKSCFIAYDDFESIDELYDFMRNITVEEHSKYIENGQKFLASENYKEFLPEAWGKNLLEIIKKANNSSFHISWWNMTMLYRYKLNMKLKQLYAGFRKGIKIK